MALICGMLTGCVNRSESLKGSEGKIIVVATIFPLADWVRQVGGDRVFVETLLPAGASPHTFDPTPRDMRLIGEAGLFVKAGLHMDDWGADLTRASGKDGPQVISLGDALAATGKLPDVSRFSFGADEDGADGHGHDAGTDGHGHVHGNINPHFWLDPYMAVASVAIIRDALIKIDPTGADIYKANADKYIKELEELDKDMATQLKPYAGRGFVSFHNAWPYLANRYGLKIPAVIEEYAGKTPSEKYLRSVTDKLRSLGIRTVFTEPQLNPHVASIIAREIGGESRLLDPYGTDNNPSRDSYLEMMRFNAKELIAAFLADAGG